MKKRIIGATLLTVVCALLISNLVGVLMFRSREVEAARKMGTPAMKLIHGYGSSGKGGRLRTACRTWLRQQELCFLPGEEFSIFNQEARRWLALCPRLRQDRDLDAENRGVTYVLLKK